MLKSLFIAEKPSVAQEFAKALKISGGKRDGYLETDKYVVTWCVGHLVTMSYPEVYDAALKRWNLDTLPFMPSKYKYEVIPSVKKQFEIVKGLLNREDVSTIYVCTDSGREGEYIYRLVDMMAQVKNKNKLRVWIDSQTEEEIIRGIKEAKPLNDYDNLCASAYLRAKEDYLMGINFSRLLTLKYSYSIKNYLKTDKNVVIAIGRVMTCVLGMIVRREREIRDFVKTPFYRVVSNVKCDNNNFEAEWKAVSGSKYFESPLLYKENGFREKKDAQELIDYVSKAEPFQGIVESIERKNEKKNPPLLYNLAELQNDCSRLFKISPDETLKIVQELYEKKLVTYPRTDARVLSTAVSKEISKNISGLLNYQAISGFAQEILDKNLYSGLSSTRYVNDKQITDHYAIIPTGQGLGALRSVSTTAACIYETIARRFVSIFLSPAVYQKIAISISINKEKFFANFKVLSDPGYLAAMEYSFIRKKEDDIAENEDAKENKLDNLLFESLKNIKKGSLLDINDLSIKEGETSPPKRYNSGSLILAMENAGQLIEDEELRAQIKGSGIGTSATRAEIIKKLVNNKYIALNKKTQIVTPTLMGEMIFDVVFVSLRPLLNPELTASWEKGLGYVAEGTITEEEYMKKLEDFVLRRTDNVKKLNNQYNLRVYFDNAQQYYKK